MTTARTTATATAAQRSGHTRARNALAYGDSQAVLDFLYRHVVDPPMCTRTIADGIGVPTPRARLILDRAARQGLVAHYDRCWHITVAGIEFYRERIAPNLPAAGGAP
jgi:hypothetical protein